jgi:hypothetical protein
MFNRVSSTEWAWLAGLLEGEGYFSGKPRLVVELEMTDKDVVERAAQLVPGGKTKVSARTRMGRNGNPHKPSYRYRWCGPRALEVMCGVRKHMGDRRRDKIDAVLATCKRKGYV